MTAVNYMADVKTAKFDASMDAHETNVRVFFFEPEPTTGRGETPIDFGRLNGVLGEMVGGYLYRARDFDHVTGEFRPTVQAVVRSPYTGDALARASHILLVERGASAGTYHRATLFGRKSAPTEVVLAWELSREADSVAIPGVVTSPPVLLESGFPLLLE